MKPRVSLTMIVKNEAANLAASLGSVAHIFAEVVVVDTGSTDDTREIAARCGARVFDFPWRDDFSAARNAALDQTTGDWVFWLDADDRINAENRDKLLALFNQLEGKTGGFRMNCLTSLGTPSSPATIVSHARLFRKQPGLRWQYRVHEQILAAILEQGGEVRSSDVVIQHTGYLSDAQRRQKRERNLQLLRLDLADHPDDPFVLFYLGWTHLLSDQHAVALPFLQKSLDQNPADIGMSRKLHSLLTRVHGLVGNREQALNVCLQGRTRFPRDTELLYQEGCLQLERGNLAAAETCMSQLLQAALDDAEACDVIPGLRGFLAHFNLAVIYRRLGRLADAATEFLAVLAEQPAYTEARIGLAEIYLAQHDRPRLTALIETLEQNPQTSVEGAVLRARVHHSRQEFAEARRLLELAVAQSPQAVSPRLFRAGILCEEGHDLAAAEEAITDVFKLEPGNLPACELGHTLAMTCRRQGRVTEAERLWRRILAERLDHGPSWLGLGGLYRELKKWAEVGQILLQMEQFPQLQVDATLLQTRACLDRHDFVTAQSALETAIARQPQVVILRIALADVLLLGGRDHSAAERVLREALALDPNSVPARHKLTQLLQQPRRPP